MRDGRDGFKAYSFVRNVYDRFAPEHLKRIQVVTTSLPAPENRAAPDLTLEETEAQPNSGEMLSHDNAFRISELTTSSSQTEEGGATMQEGMATTREQLERVLQQIEQ